MKKTIIAALVTCALSTGIIGAEPKSQFQSISRGEASQNLKFFSSSRPESNAAMWIWADKNVYQPGDPLTLRWTVKTNNEMYPYTIVAYRQNNQTGVKTYLPGGSTTPTDIFGNTAAQGFRITRLSDATKQVLVGAGGTISPSPLGLPDEKGMHTIVVQLRDYTGGQVIKSAYVKFGIVSGYENLPNSISSDLRLTNDKAYRVSGIVSVTNNATLTIDPGTYIIGMPGSQPPSVLLITTLGKINASGTRSRPIIMTSSQPIGSRNRGDWGGLILLGKAVLNDPAGALSIEGLPELPETLYGGDNDAHNCGTLRYVRVEFAGSLLRPNEETNSFTFGACGTETKAEFLQAHYGLDDSFEWFGGSANAKHIVATYGADDFIDTQIGYRGKIQFAVSVSNDDQGNRGIEQDNYERDFGARPLNKPTMYNLTFVGGGAKGYDESDAPCLYFRRGAGGITNNVICYNWVTRTLGGGNFDTILPNISSGDFNMNGILAWNNGREAGRGNTLEEQVSADLLDFARKSETQFVLADPQLFRPLERNDPDFRPKSNSPAWGANWIQPPDDGFFDQTANYIGAFGDEDWTEEWTSFLQEQDIQ